MSGKESTSTLGSMGSALKAPFKALGLGKSTDDEEIPKNHPGQVRAQARGLSRDSYYNRVQTAELEWTCFCRRLCQRRRFRSSARTMAVSPGFS